MVPPSHDASTVDLVIQEYTLQSNTKDFDFMNEVGNYHAEVFGKALVHVDIHFLRQFAKAGNVTIIDFEQTAFWLHCVFSRYFFKQLFQERFSEKIQSAGQKIKRLRGLRSKILQIVEKDDRPIAAQMRSMLDRYVPKVPRGPKPHLAEDDLILEVAVIFAYLGGKPAKSSEGPFARVLEIVWEIITPYCSSESLEAFVGRVKNDKLQVRIHQAVGNIRKVANRGKIPTS